MQHNRTSAASQLFNSVWATLPRIVYKESWANNTGYFDGVTTDNLELSKGDYVATADPIGRRLIIKCLDDRGFNQVLFERGGPSNVIVCNTPHPKHGVLVSNAFNGSLSDKTIQVFLGLREPNVVFHPDWYADAFEGVNFTKHLQLKIENSIPFTMEELAELGINLDSCIVSMCIKEYNV